VLTRLRFANFKAWRDTGDIRLAPLTVLFGANSAGKTSIPQLLLLMKQTAASPDRQRALQLGDSRTLVDLGVYADIVHAHEVEHALSFELDWAPAERVSVTDPISGVTYGGDRVSFKVEIEADARQQPIVRRFHYALEAMDREALRVEMRRINGQKKFELSATPYQLLRHAGRPWPLPEPQRFYGFPDEATAYYQNTAFTADFVLSLERQLNSLHYVGPLRDYPSRLYLWSGEVPEHVGVRGEKAIEAILAARGRAFNFRPKERKRSLDELVAERLQVMGLIHAFEVKQLGKHRKEYEVLVRTGARMPEVKLTDVGFGVSQVLPVIVECFYVQPNSVVLFEQPEIHLHPRVQAELADLFIDAVTAREDGLERNCQFIVESHSEHFLRRLQRRIAEKRLTVDDAALYFVSTQEDHATLEPLDLDMFGEIRNWPENFFGDEMEDLVARAEARAHREGESQ
jgi:predicted ATPase